MIFVVSMCLKFAMHVPFTRDLPSIPLLTAGLHDTRFSPIRPIIVYQGKIYDGGENGYAKTGILDFPRGNTVFVCVVILRPRLISMVMSGRLVNLTKLFLDRHTRERECAYTVMSPVGNSTLKKS